MISNLISSSILQNLQISQSGTNYDYQKMTMMSANFWSLTQLYRELINLESYRMGFAVQYKCLTLSPYFLLPIIPPTKIHKKLKNDKKHKYL